ncbi:hypothetical protein WJX84_010214 [Apatococcus fuscideae]|uniref:Smr domain-containing protein n=1 Tax=Apatococcus fuscideae TaxID=2026836 RepID=A0AAW1STG1_9CHLO
MKIGPCARVHPGRFRLPTHSSPLSSRSGVPDVLYAGAFLDAAQHDKLLKAVPAAFSVISADHLTLRYRPSNQWLQSLPLGAQLELTISFVALQDGLQAVNVGLDEEAAWLADLNPHITISVAPGVPAKLAGNLIGLASSHQLAAGAIRHLTPPLRLSGVVGVKLTSGQICLNDNDMQQAAAAAQASLCNATPDASTVSGPSQQGRHRTPAGDRMARALHPGDMLASSSDDESAHTLERLLLAWQSGVSDRERRADHSQDPLEGLLDMYPGLDPVVADLILQDSKGNAAAAAAFLSDCLEPRMLAEKKSMHGAADVDRQTMHQHQAQANFFFSSATQARSIGDREAAYELEAKGQEHIQLAQQARRRTNQAAFIGSNLTNLCRMTIDLHGLHVEEALTRLEDYLIKLGGLAHPAGILLRVVTGVGRHSIGGRARILPAVVRYLTEAGYRFEEQQHNAGVLHVVISRAVTGYQAESGPDLDASSPDEY